MAELKWVATRCAEVLIPALEAAETEDEIKQVCDAEIEYWKSRAGTPNSLRTPHTQSRNVVRWSNLPEYKKVWTLQYLSLGEENWTQINSDQAPKLAERLEHQLLLEEPDRIVNQAEALLRAERWQDVAAGLTVVIGRRSTEVLKTGEIEICTAYSVLFGGQLKQRGNKIKPFEIPTLVPAALVLDAFGRLRASLDTSEMGTHAVSNNYHKAVSASVLRHFAALVPARAGETVSAHTMRAVYLRLAIYFYCPVLVDAETFAAQISGHRSYTSGEEQRSYGAGPNYNDYKISDRAGNIDGRQGVKLGLDGVEPIGVFSESNGAVKVLKMPLKGIMEEPVKMGVLTPESLFIGEDCQLIKDGMEAANVTDFMSYLTLALKRQAKNDLGLARRDMVVDVESMSMDDLLSKRKHSTATERIRRAVAAIAAYNDDHVQMERWFINATVLSYLIGGRFQTILDYLKEHQSEIDEINGKYNLTEKYNRKPIAIKDTVEVK